MDVAIADLARQFFIPGSVTGWLNKKVGEPNGQGTYDSMQLLPRFVLMLIVMEVKLTLAIVQQNT